MAGKFKFTLEDYQQAAIKYLSELLYLPIFSINDTLQHMTCRPGIRYAERVGTISADAQFAPYNHSREEDIDLQLDFRELKTYFGSVVTNFEPNTAISTLLGTGSTKGDGQMTTPTARHVLALIAKGLSKHLNDAVWNGKRNAAGNTTKDLFDGFDTITVQEIAAGEISEAKDNYVKLADTMNPANVVDILKQLMFEMDPHLRATDCNIYCSQQLVDIYNEG